MHMSAFSLIGRRVFVLVLLLGGSVLAAQAQSLSDFERSRFAPASYFNYAEPGDVTIVVNVWGTVRNPGLYEIPQGTRLSTLLSLAGGPIVQPRQRRQSRTVSVRLMREQAGQRGQIFEMVMVDEIFAAPDDPVLLERDVLTIETEVRQGFSFRDAFPIVAAFASVALAIDRISQ